MSLEFIYNSKSCKSCFAYKDLHTCTKGAKLNEIHKYSQVFKLFKSFVVPQENESPPTPPFNNNLSDVF